MISDEDIKQLFQKMLDTPDVVTGLMKISGSSSFHLSSKFRLQIFRGISSRLWKDAPPAGCLRHKTIVNTFRVIPEYCFDCYKVLVAPRTVVELFKLLLVFGKIELPNNNSRKCMTERRNTSPGAYKGFIYCRGAEEAKEVLNIVRKAVSDDISFEVPVTLARGCSEFAQVHSEFGRINQGVATMKYKPEWRFYEDFVDQNFVFESAGDPDTQGFSETPAANTGDKTVYPPWEIFTMQYWLGYAATIGDMSYLTISGKTLPPIPDLKRPKFTPPSPPPLAIFR
jgi:hypothetical protein